ncbi:MAG: hypothetical protein H7A42_02135 [Chlamydiales bacterium]|nr:hypothetical protein [Chlamydiales bacterium]
MAITNYSSKNYDQFCEFYQAQVERYRNGESVPSHLIWMIQFGSRSFFTQNLNVNVAVPIREFDVERNAFEILKFLDSFCRRLIRNLQKHKVYEVCFYPNTHDSYHYLIDGDLFLEKMMRPKLNAETSIGFTYEKLERMGTEIYTVVAYRKRVLRLEEMAMDVIERCDLLARKA